MLINKQHHKDYKEHCIWIIKRHYTHLLWQSIGNILFNFNISINYTNFGRMISTKFIIASCVAS